MPPAPWEVYAEQLGNIGLGRPLWQPDKPDDGLEIGDVGWIMNGAFISFFNVVNGSPTSDLPPNFNPLRFNSKLKVRNEHLLDPGPIRSSTVQEIKVEATAGADAGAAGAGFGFKFSCSKNQGAILILKDIGSQELIQPSARFTDYVRNNHKNWYEYARDQYGLDMSTVKKEDLILVSGVIKTSSWGVAAFVDRSVDHELNFNGQFGPLATAGASVGYQHASSVSGATREGPKNRPIAWAAGNESATHPRDQNVFINYYKVKYRLGFFMKVAAAAEPRQDSDEPEGSSPEPILEVEAVPALQRSHDPLDDVLDYILERSDADMAITSTGDVNELCGRPWPENLRSNLDIHMPRIEVAYGENDGEPKAGYLSISDRIVDRNRAIFGDEDADELVEHDKDSKAVEGSSSTTATDSLQSGSLVLGSKLQAETINWPHRVFLEKTAEGGAACSLAVSPDGQYVASGFEDAIVRVWHLESGALMHKLSGHLESVWDVAFSPDSNRVITGSADRNGMLWDLTAPHDDKSLGPTAVLQHDNGVWVVAFSPDGEKAATGSVDFTVKIWDAVTGENRATLGQHTAVVLCLAFSPDGKALASAADATGYIWNPDTGEPINNLKGHDGIIWSLTYSHNGARIVTGSEDHTVRVWDATEGDELVVIREHTGPVWSVAFSPDDKDIVSGSYDASVSLCDSYTGASKHLLKDRPAIVNVVAYSPDGMYIIAGCADGSIKLWETLSGTMVAELQGHKDKVKEARFTPEGDNIVSSSDDGTVRAWSLLDVLRVA